MLRIPRRGESTIATEMLRDLQRNAKQNSKEMLRLPRELQSEMQRKCLACLVKFHTKYEENAKDLQETPKADVRSRGRFASPGPEPDMR